MFEGRARPTALRPGSRFPRAVRELSQSRWRYAVAAVLFAGILLGIFARGKSIVWGEDAEYAALSDVEFGVGIRAEADDNLMVAIDLFHEAEYDKSIRVLERLLRSDPTYPFPEYLSYSLGVVKLKASREMGGGFFISIYDKVLVKEGLKHLRSAVLSSASPRLIEESYWLMAKGHFMLVERDSGLQCLHKVIQIRGKRGDEANRLRILVESKP
jgi:hypothetical protein